MPFTKLQFRPGVNREVTQYANEGGWYDMDKIRFRFGFPEKIGGWTLSGTEYFAGVCRHLNQWIDLRGNLITGIGTNLKFYIRTGGSLYDITPIRDTTAAGDVTFSAVHTTLSAAINDDVTEIPLTSVTNFPTNGGWIKIDSEEISYTAVSGSSLIGCARGQKGTTAASHVAFSNVGSASVIVTDTAHGAIDGDFVTFSGAVSLGGNLTADVLNQEYQIVQVLSPNSYVIEARTASSLVSISTQSGPNPTYVYSRSSTNIWQMSDAVNVTPWSYTNVNITVNADVAPDGRTSADKVIPTAANVNHWTGQSYTKPGTIPITGTFSFYAKASGYNFVRAQFGGAGQGSGESAVWDLVNGTVSSTGSGGVASIEDVGSGWYRCILTGVWEAATIAPFITPLPTSASVTSFLGNGTDGILLWGTQLEDGSTVSPYIQTQAAFTTAGDLGNGGTAARTNRSTRSEEMNDAAWAKIRSSATANAGVAPDGATTADKLVENTDTNTHYVDSPYVSGFSGLPTGSIYLKAVERTEAVVQIIRDTGGAVASTTSFINLSAGTVTSGPARIDDVGSGWFRVSVQATTSGSNYCVRVQIASGGATSYTGNGTSGILVWGAQLEDGWPATAYIPTTTTAVTVAADNDTIGAYQANVGPDSAVSGSGWGAGTWSRDGWGSPSSITVAGDGIRLWTADNFGEDLLYNIRDGGIYYWDATNGPSVRGVALSSLPGSATAPTIAAQIMVSERDRHVIAFGCDDEFSIGTQDPLLIRFSDQENLTDWRSLPTNTAGSLRIGSGSKIICAVETKQQTMVFTDTSLHTMQYLGPPFTFGINVISENITIASPNAAISVDDTVYWMGFSEFYSYNGVVTNMPCTVRQYVFGDLNTSQFDKVVAGLNSSYSEVWWFYPSADSQTNDRYVVYNYQQDIWYFGTMARTAWIDRGVDQLPLAAGQDYSLYYHESGLDDGSANPATAINAYIQSSGTTIGAGDQFAMIHKMIPDIDFTGSGPMPSVTMTVKANNFPGGVFMQEDDGNVMRTASVPVQQFTNQLYLRLRGRSFFFRVESNTVGTTWRLGAPRLEVRTDGQR